MLPKSAMPVITVTIVETAKGYMGHERATLENITKARNLAAQPQGVASQAKAEGELKKLLIARLSSPSALA